MLAASLEWKKRVSRKKRRDRAGLEKGRRMTGKHYMYVLECADGSLYTGYAVDVQARLAVHNAGKGAKYTRARLPVSLLAYAEFPTKHDAMHAEYVFKQLSRNEKDALLAAASHSSFEEALRELLA